MIFKKNENKQLVEAIATHAAAADEANAFPAAAFDAITSKGLLNIVLPQQELDFNKPNALQLLQLLKLIGYADLAAGRIFEGHINALYLIHLYATPEQRNNLYGDASANKLFGVWNTEPSNGVRINKLNDTNYKLEGNKTFCSGGNYIKRPLLTGELFSGENKGWQMCILLEEKVKDIKQDPDSWNPLGMKSSISYQIDFSGIEIQQKDLIGKPGDYYKQPYFGGGAMRFTAVQLGGAEALFDACKNFLKEHNRHNDSFQQARFGEAAYLLSSGNNWLHNAADKINNWHNDDEVAQNKIIVFANMMRTAIEEICTRVMALMIKSVGARGLMPPYQIARLHRNLTFYLRQPAPDAALLNIGKFALSENDISEEL